MPVSKVPFTSYTLDKDKKEIKDVFSVRLNQEERAWLDELKEDLNIKSDSKALKIGALIGKNVIQSQFTRPVLRYLFKKDRLKLTDYKNF
jgi:hypothetical protein